MRLMLFDALRRPTAQARGAHGRWCSPPASSARRLPAIGPGWRCGSTGWRHATRMDRGRRSSPRPWTGRAAWRWAIGFRATKRRSGICGRRCARAGVPWRPIRAMPTPTCCWATRIAGSAGSAPSAWETRLPLLRQMRRQQAIATLQRALALKPDSLAAHARLVTLYEQAGALDLALRHLQAFERIQRRTAPGPASRQPNSPSASRAPSAMCNSSSATWMPVPRRLPARPAARALPRGHSVRHSSAWPRMRWPCCSMRGARRSGATACCWNWS